MMMSPGSGFILCLLLLLQNRHVEANDSDNVCSVAGERGVTVDILSCGIQNPASCANTDKMVPVMTVALADCWGTSTLVMRCHSDGYWRTQGAQVPGGLDPDTYFEETQPMRRLCQPFHINSSVCGRKPRYRSSGSTIHFSPFVGLDNRWPMVMGLKKKQRYECSATLITPLFLLTAAHCVIVSQESRDMHEDVRNLKVQLSNYNDDQFVAEIYIHPDYEPGQTPVNDLAIIRLDGPLSFNDKLYPACVDLVGYYIDPTYNAVTFSRPNGKNRHEYDEILQQTDTTCQARFIRCRTLEITDTQFCGVDLATKRQLVGGSSGGPFILNLGSDDSEEWAITGVVSSITEQHGCDQAHTIFTAINSFGTWITGIVHANIPSRLPTASMSATFPTTTTTATTTPLTSTRPASTPPATTPSASTPPATTPSATTPPATTPPATTPPAITPPAITPPATTSPTITPPATTPPTITPPATTPLTITPPATTPSTITPPAITPPATTPLTITPPATTPPATTPSRTTTALTHTVAPLMPGLHPSGSYSCADNTIPMGAYQIQKQMPDGSVQMHHYLVCSEVASTYRGPLTGVATTRTASCPSTAPLYAGFDRGAGPCAHLVSGWRMTTTCRNGDNQGILPASVPAIHIRYIGCFGLNNDRDFAVTEYITSGSGFREELQHVKCCKVVPI